MTLLVRICKESIHSEHSCLENQDPIRRVREYICIQKPAQLTISNTQNQHLQEEDTKLLALWKFLSPSLKAYPISFFFFMGIDFNSSRQCRVKTFHVFKTSCGGKHNPSWQVESLKFSGPILSTKLSQEVERLYLHHYNNLHQAGLLAYLSGLFAILYSGKKKKTPGLYHHYSK